MKDTKRGSTPHDIVTEITTNPDNTTQALIETTKEIASPYVGPGGGMSGEVVDIIFEYATTTAKKIVTSIQEWKKTKKDAPLVKIIDNIASFFTKVGNLFKSTMKALANPFLDIADRCIRATPDLVKATKEVLMSPSRQLLDDMDKGTRVKDGEQRILKTH